MNLAMCIDIVGLCFWIANGQICQFLTGLSACDTFVFLFLDNNLGRSQWIFTKLDVCIDVVESWFGMGKFHQFVSELSAHDMITAGYYRFTFCIKKGCLL